MLWSSITRKAQTNNGEPSAALIPSIQELFTFSPFGLRCRQCSTGVTIQLDERSIQIHLKKHGMDSRVVTVRSFFDTLETKLVNVKASGIIEPYRSDDKTYVGYSCICGQVFRLRKDSAIRHCKKVGCDATKLQTVELIKLCCGRFVSQSQVTAFFNKQRQAIIESPASPSPDFVVGCQDIAPAVSPLPPIRDLFIVSPFGLRCRQCNKGVTILLDQRSIYNHLRGRANFYINFPQVCVYLLDTSGGNYYGGFCIGCAFFVIGCEIYLGTPYIGWYRASPVEVSS